MSSSLVTNQNWCLLKWLNTKLDLKSWLSTQESYTLNICQRQKIVRPDWGLNLWTIVDSSLKWLSQHIMVPICKLRVTTATRAHECLNTNQNLYILNIMTKQFLPDKLNTYYTSISIKLNFSRVTISKISFHIIKQIERCGILIDKITNESIKHLEN